MKKFLLLCFSFVFVLSAWAQDRVVSGRVTSSEDGSALPGVNVVLKGTTNGTVTDTDGNFRLTVPSTGGSLVFSFIGLTTQEVSIGDRSTVDISLGLDVTQLGEVVVTAQGVQQEKKALGYAVTTVNSAQIANRPEADVSRILQGKIPGVNITSTSGVSGTGTNIIIRGYSSVTGSNQPLFVVDGVPFNTNTNQQTSFASGGTTTSSRMLDLDPNNIESVSVLKGLSATVLYGDQGRNGVILITTKTGGKTNKAAEVTVSQSFYQNSIASLPDYQNNYGGGFQQLTPVSWFFSNWGANFADVPVVKNPIGLSTVAFIRNGFPEYAIDPSQPWGPTNAASIANVVDYENKAYPNIGESFFRKGNVANTSVQISGSSGSTGFNASVGYQDEQGFTEGNDLTKLNLGLGINSSLSDKFSIKTSFNYANTDMATPPLNVGFGSNANGGIPSVFANVMYTPRNVDLGGLPFEHPVDKSSVYYRGGNDITNPRWITKNYSNTSVVNRFFNSTSLNYDLSENFSVTYRMGLDTYTETQEWKYNKGGGAGQTLNVQNGIYNSFSIKNTIWNHDVILNYKTRFNEKLGLTALVGANNRYDRYEQFGVSSSGQVAFGLFNHSNFQTSSSRNIIDGSRMNFMTEQRRIGVYANATLDFADYLFVNLMARNDWTSTVEEENRQILYPGASVSFIPSTAFSLPDVIDLLKVRVGYGTSAGFPNPYNTRNILSQSTRSFVPSGSTTPLISQTISNGLGNPNLKPELQQELEFGVEGNLMKGRIGVDLSLYQRQTKDLITNAPIDPATGFTSTNINIGEMETKGIDLIVTGVPFRGASGLTWDITWNFGKYRSTITDLGTDLDEVVIAGFSSPGNYAIKDKPFGIIKGIGIERDPATGEKIVQPSGRYLPTTDPVELGDPNPAFTTSLINGVSYKNFRLSFMFEYRHKGVIVSQTVTGVLARGLTTDTDVDRSTTFILPGVQADGSKNTVQISAANYFFDNYFFSDEAVTFDGSTIRLREISLSYNLPKTILGKSPFKAASITLTGSNIWFEALNFPKGLNFDTDVLSTGVGNGLGFDYLTGPSARRIGGTISLTF